MASSEDGHLLIQIRTTFVDWTARSIRRLPKFVGHLPPIRALKCYQRPLFDLRSSPETRGDESKTLSLAAVFVVDDQVHADRFATQEVDVDSQAGQLRSHHYARGCPTDAKLVKADVKPANLAKWFERRLSSWSRDLVTGRATPHVFRKTALQYARRGEDVNASVAHDARLGAGVMMRHYVKQTDPERRAASNRTFYRIAASLAPETARRYGHSVNAKNREELETELRDAVRRKAYERVTQLSVTLASQQA